MPEVTRTPIVYSAELSAEIGGNIWVKREDLQDGIGSGVKRRAVAATLSHLVAQGKSAIVADGVAQSNCLHALAHYAHALGVPVHLLVRGELPDVAAGNYRGLLRSGAAIRHVRDPATLETHVRTTVAHLQRRGLDPLVVPAGAAATFAAGGPLGLGCEIARQERGLGVRFDDVVLPAGTGGTATGLAFSRALHGSQWRVVGVRVDDYPLETYQRLADTVAGALEIGGGGARGLPFHLHDGAVGAGYGRFGRGEVAEAERLAQRTGLYFGPTYMLKTVAGLRQLRAHGVLRRNARVLLVHTGGINERETLAPGPPPTADGPADERT
jgi:1-aminocyclopropane-1-carboxylate deaminase/D-cysteine desulfhydrase-like pyridoxal-dependent ACC family enzyme